MPATALGLELSVEEQERLFLLLARKRDPSIVEVLAMEKLNIMLTNRKRVEAWKWAHPAEHQAIVDRYEARRAAGTASKRTHYMYDEDRGLCGIYYPLDITEDIKAVTCHSCRRRYNRGMEPRT